MTPVFPVLAGQDISFTKKPTFSTIVAPHVSGREVRDALCQNPIWEFEVSFNALDSSPGNIYGGGVGSQSLQVLMGLFLQCQGQFGTFVFYDPTDYAVAAQGFGTGDGATTTFQLLRSLGPFAEAVSQPWVPSTFSVFPAQGATAYAPTNVYKDSSALASGIGLGNISLTGAETDPNGGTLAVLLAETTATGAHDAPQASIPIVAGSPVTFSAYLKAGGLRYCELTFDNGGSNGFGATFDLSAGAVTASGKLGAASGLVATISAAGNSYFRCAVSGIIDTVSTIARASIVSNDNATTWTWYPSYAGSTSNTLSAAFPQVELAASPGAPTSYKPTLTTLDYGQPSITAGGTYIDPSAYSISNGAVTFTTPPASGAALQWTGYFGFLCRFDDDSAEFEQFMSQLWRAKSVKFRSVRAF